MGTPTDDAHKASHRAFRDVLVDVACGLVAAFAVTRVMMSRLFGVSAIDELSYGAGVLVLLAAAALGSVIPTARATRTSLASVLRAE
ncbi:MAG: hypothetical protein IT182_09530 [Acidobacteria bacterium]|nr:hypothetical protein [Acidobacteriota bacterium]